MENPSLKLLLWKKTAHPAAHEWELGQFIAEQDQKGAEFQQPSLL
jgi:hypothetical protein